MTFYQNKYRVESIWLKNWNYGLPGVYFITICAEPKILWFGNVHNGIVYLNNFGPQKNNLSSIIRGFKSKATKHIRLNYNTEFGWQSRFYEHIIKNNSELIAARKYIKNNPKDW